MKPKGFLIVSAIIFAAIVACVSLVLSKSMVLSLATHRQRCAYYKTGFLGQSGFVYARNNWGAIPDAAFIPTRESLYAHYTSGFLVPGLDGTLSLLKTPTTLYSIALGPHHARAIFYASFTKTNDTVILGPIQKL